MAVADQDVTVTELSGTRAQKVQRLQVGVFGLCAMLLLIALASIFIDRQRQVEASAVPEAAATIAAGEAEPVVSDPLADAGVVPDLPANPEARATQTPSPDAPDADIP